MDSAMWSKARNFDKSFATIFTFIRLFSSMNYLMFNKIWAASNDFTAVIKLVRLPSMKSLVMIKTWVLFKGFATLCTFIRLLFSMNSLMSSKTWATVKGFATYLTFIRFLASMDSLMLSKISATQKAFATYCTFKRFPSWIFLCLVRLDELVKTFPHILHLLSFRGFWILCCRVRSEDGSETFRGAPSDSLRLFPMQPPRMAAMPCKTEEIKDNRLTAGRKDAKSVKIKKNKDNVKFPVWCSGHLYTLVIMDKKAEKSKQTRPPGSAVKE